jgi:hypothetical protein
MQTAPLRKDPSDVLQRLHTPGRVGDTVATGGRCDGNPGVLSGLSVVHALNMAGTATGHPLVVAVFTNEEGVRS